MPGKVVIIVGLPAAGKTTRFENEYENDSIGWELFDDWFEKATDNRKDTFSYGRNYSKLIEKLRAGINCVVADIYFCKTEALEDARASLEKAVPGIDIEIDYIENNPKKCRSNAKKRDREGLAKELSRIEQYSPGYQIPNDAKIIPVGENDKETD